MSVGMVGGGQLARMTAEAASALGIRFVVLAADPTDASVDVAHDVVIGSAKSIDDLRALGARCDVITFDHEQVDVDAVRSLEIEGHRIRPGSHTLEVATDKSVMRETLAGAGIEVPKFQLVGSPESAGEPGNQLQSSLAVIESFSAVHGWPVVLKASRGGYDGKGVWKAADLGEAERVCVAALNAGVSLIVEEAVPIDLELAVLVARRPGGESVTWAPVETTQIEGVCRETLVPGRLERDVAALACDVARAVSDEVGAVGVLSVEMFWARGELMVNEIAARPHNAGHWTIEGSVTSQFENHLRAVLDLPLGQTTTTAANVACVNVFGSGEDLDPRQRLPLAMELPGAHVHLYAKAPVRGRKLGHVTVCGEDADDVRYRALEAARRLGTPLPDELVANEALPVTEELLSTEALS
ncbi:MAG: 5-(carboxyamino)imidazole ribonucleotide synthase [Acidimicrobiales bacterium]